VILLGGTKLLRGLFRSEWDLRAMTLEGVHTMKAFIGVSWDTFTHWTERENSEKIAARSIVLLFFFCCSVWTFTHLSFIWLRWENALEQSHS